MNRVGSLRNIIINKITYEVCKSFNHTSLCVDLGLDFHLKLCPLFADACERVELFENIDQRIAHWESDHPNTRLGWGDCAWIVGGGLLKWQRFKSKYESKLPPPEVNSKKRKTWSLQEIKEFVAKNDLDDIKAVQVQVWTAFRAKVEQNESKWSQETAELLDLPIEECSLEELRKLNAFQVNEKVKSWVTPIVCCHVPKHLDADCDDTWGFVKIQSNRKWLEEFGIDRPCELFGYREFDEHETWEVLKDIVDEYSSDEDDDSAIVTNRNSLPTMLAVSTMQIVQILELTLRLHTSSWMALAEDVSKYQLSKFIELYKLAYSLENDAVIEIIATPNCSVQELHELILENCCNSYSGQHMPKNLSARRRLTWYTVTKGNICSDCLIVIAHAQNLSKAAVQEIEDLNVRCEVSFLLATSTDEIEACLFYIIDQLNSLIIPPAEIVQEVINAVKSMVKQGMDIEEAFDAIQSQSIASSPSEV
jgi:hypothetical protein